MVLDKGSIKELYDNRDIIAQLGNLQHDMEHLPHGHQLQLLWEYMILFINRYDYLMFEDRSAYIDAKQTYASPPGYDPSKNFKKLDNIGEQDFVSKEMLKDFEPGNYLRLDVLDTQTVLGSVKFNQDLFLGERKIEDIFLVKNGAATLQQKVNGSVNFDHKLYYNGVDLNDKYLIKNGGEELEQSIQGTVNIPKKLTVNNAEVKGQGLGKNDGHIFHVEGESLFDGDVNCFGHFNGEMVDVRYGEFAERPSLKTGSEQPLVGNNFITLDDLTPIANKYVLLESSTKQLISSKIDVATSLGVGHNYGYPNAPGILLQVYPIHSRIIFNEHRQTYESEPVVCSCITAYNQNTENGLDFDVLKSNKTTLRLAMRHSSATFNFFDDSGELPIYVRCADNAFDVKYELPDIIYTSLNVNRGTIALYNKAKNSFLYGINCTTTGVETLYQVDSNKSISHLVDNMGVKIKTPRLTVNMLEDRFNVTVPSNDGAPTDTCGIAVGPSGCEFKVGNTTGTEFAHITLTYANSGFVKRAIRLEASTGTLYTRPYLEVNQNGIYTNKEIVVNKSDSNGGSPLVTEEYVKNNTIQPIKTSNENYEQIELPFNLFNRPISLIIRRIKEGNMFRDQLLTKTDNNIKIISDQYTAM